MFAISRKQNVEIEMKEQHDLNPVYAAWKVGSRGM